MNLKDRPLEFRSLPLFLSLRTISMFDNNIIQYVFKSMIQTRTIRIHNITEYYKQLFFGLELFSSILCTDHLCAQPLLIITRFYVIHVINSVIAYGTNKEYDLIVTVGYGGGGLLCGSGV